MTDSLSDSGLSLTDAAAQLGISERTVLRRIKDGTIAGRKIGEGRGGVWRVYLGSVSDTRTAAVSDSPTDALGRLTDSQTETAGRVSDSMSDSPTQPAPEVLELVRMVDERQAKIDQLQAELREASSAAAHWQARAVTAEQTVQRLLPAPKDEPEPPAVPEPRRSWWRRFLGSE